MNLFKGKKSPSDLVKSCKKHLSALLDEKNKDEKAMKKSQEKLSANMAEMKFMLYGDGDSDPKQPDVKKLGDELFAPGNDVLLVSLCNLKKLEFEARKDLSHVYNFVLRQRKDEAIAFVKKYHAEIVKSLITGYADSEVALNCGAILREILRHEVLAELVLENKLFDQFFEYVQVPTFDVASDAFATFKLLLTKHKVLCAKFLEKNFDELFKKYNELLQSRNYVTKRQSLKLLGEILLNRTNFNVMIKYINSPDNLKVMMNLLRGTTKAIQFEAFHVFKIFVANPKKSKGVTEILVRNRDKLVEFLRKFQKEKEDEQFNEERNILLTTLEALDDSILKQDGKTAESAAAPSTASAAAPSTPAPAPASK